MNYDSYFWWEKIGCHLVTLKCLLGWANKGSANKGSWRSGRTDDFVKKSPNCSPSDLLTKLIHNFFVKMAFILGLLNCYQKLPPKGENYPSPVTLVMITIFGEKLEIFLEIEKQCYDYFFLHIKA
jgi:hypothetical protein